jgi:hypothetical protein
MLSKNADVPGGPFSGAPFPSELFPGGLEVMGQWVDPETLRSRTWVRFHCAAQRDAFSRIFDSPTFLAFMCSRELRSAIALEPQGDLSCQDRERVSEILRERECGRFVEQLEPKADRPWLTALFADLTRVLNSVKRFIVAIRGNRKWISEDAVRNICAR